jgi:hypothetical protein
MPINLKYGKIYTKNENFPPKLACIMGKAKLFAMKIFKSLVFKVHFLHPLKFSASFSSNFTVCHVAETIMRV